MRIAIICHRGIGGSARVAVDLASQLAARQHEVHLFARTAALGLVDGSNGVHVHTLDTPAPTDSRLDVNWSREDLDAMANMVAEVDVDVLHYHYAVPFAAVAQAVRDRLGSAAPVTVGTLHGTDVTDFGYRPVVRRELAHALATTDALTAVSASLASLATQLFQLPYAPAVVPNFIDLEKFKPVAGRSHMRPRIAHVSNLRPVKAPETMARTFVALRRLTDAELWLVGDGEGRRQMDAVLDAGGVASDVRRFGLRLDPESILPHTDVLLVTSHMESFSLAALEAAACGIPVVAPAIGGIPEVVRHGVTGLLHAPGDQVASVGALAGLLDDKRRRVRMGAAARNRAAELAGPAVVPRYEKIYQQLVRAAAPRSLALAGRRR